MKKIIKIELDIPEGCIIPDNPIDILNYNDIRVISAEYSDVNDCYDVYKNGILVATFNDYDQALKHAVKIDGNVLHSI